MFCLVLSALYLGASNSNAKENHWTISSISNRLLFQVLFVFFSFTTVIQKVFLFQCQTEIRLTQWLGKKKSEDGRLDKWYLTMVRFNTRVKCCNKRIGMRDRNGLQFKISVIYSSFFFGIKETLDNPFFFLFYQIPNWFPSSFEHNWNIKHMFRTRTINNNKTNSKKSALNRNYEDTLIQWYR